MFTSRETPCMLQQINFYRLDDMQYYYGNNYIMMLYYSQYLVLYCNLSFHLCLGWKTIKTRKVLIFLKKGVAALYFMKALCLTNISQWTRLIRLGPVRFDSVRNAVWTLPFHNVGLFPKPNRFGSILFGSARAAVWMRPKASGQSLHDTSCI